MCSPHRGRFSGPIRTPSRTTRSEDSRYVGVGPSPKASVCSQPPDLSCADALRLPRTKVTVTATAEGLMGEPVELDLTTLAEGALVPLPLRRTP